MELLREPGKKGVVRLVLFAPPFSRIRVEFEVSFRLCEHKDLRALEWEGLFREHRRVIERAFRRQLRGDNLMLLTEANGMPIGQVWIDLRLRRKERIAYLWAMRVLPWFQRWGIGRELLGEAERLALDHGFRGMELVVDKANTAAKHLYRQAGYRKTKEVVEYENYTTRTGRRVKLRRPRFVMRKKLTPELPLSATPTEGTARSRGTLSRPALA